MSNVLDTDFVKKLLSDTNGFSDKETPVLITSGASLTPFFVNAEKLTQDPNISKALKKFANEPFELTDYCNNLAFEIKTGYEQYSQLISHLANEIELIFDKAKGFEKFAISGGQRRDWVFSGPVAEYFDTPHIALFKPDKNLPAGAQKLIHNGEGSLIEEINHDKPLEGVYVVHIADMLTKASSMYSKNNGNEIGWIPQLRERGATIDTAISVVSRLQGGEELLESIGVNPISYVQIDGNFLSEFSNQPDVAIAYIHDETKWTQDYLLKNGVDVLVPYAEPGSDKNARLNSFLNQYDGFLKSEKLMEPLAQKINDKYNIEMNQIRRK